MNGLYSDMDSLSEGAQTLGTKFDFDRDKVLNWIRNQNNFIGGETSRLGSVPYSRFPSVPYEAGIMGTQYLNREYSNVIYGPWEQFVYNEANVTAPIFYPHNGKTVTMIFDPVYDGRKGMEFMRDRLGYRLVVREAMASAEIPLDTNSELHFRGKIQNVGFGNVINKKGVYVLLKDKTSGEVYKATTDIDARDWLKDQNIPLNNRPDNVDSWRDLNFSVTLGQFNKRVPPG